MKDKIHPKYYIVEAECDCGNKFKVGSTKNRKIKVEVCSACHPLYTGKSKLVDTTGRVKRYKEMIAKAKQLKIEAKPKKKRVNKQKKNK